MKKALLFLVAGFLCLTVCRAGQQSAINGAQHVTAEKGTQGGLDFLADIPSMKGVSLKMSESEFLEIVRRQELKYKREMKTERTTYMLSRRRR